MNSPKVSICIPTYNGRTHLRECLDSIRAQSFNDFEVLLCDDQSSDGTLDLAREIAGADERFRFISNPRRFGLVGNWNNCIALARGEWIKFVFQDDIIEPACLEKLLHACEQTQNKFGFCARDFIFETGVTESLHNWFVSHRERLQSDYQPRRVISPENVIRRAIREPAHNPVGEPTVTLIHRSLFSELGKFDESLIQLCDSEFWNRVLVNHGGVFVAESLAKFRIHAKAATALNHGARAYRMGVLDPLVLRCRFAFGRHFKPMRNPWLTDKSIFALRVECAADAAHAWRLAQNNFETAAGAPYNAYTEWQAVTANFHELKTLAFLGRIINLFRRIKSAVARQVRRLT